MAKQQHTIKLAGYKSDGTLANTHEGDQVVVFKNTTNSIHVRQTCINSNQVRVLTHDGRYILRSHGSIANLYTVKLANGLKMHFTKKKLVAKLIYWA